jgi:Gpi18-like mannosyltransferase
MKGPVEPMTSRFSAEARNTSPPRLPVTILGRWVAWLRRHGLTVAIGVVALVITIAIRAPLFAFHGSDLDGGFLLWCDDIKRLGLAGAMALDHVDYNAPYLYLLWLANVLPFDRAHTIKMYSVFFDYVAAAAMAALVYRETRSAARSFGAAFVLLITPTVVFNGALWGQCDMIPSALLLVAVATALAGRHWASAALFGAALAFKLQAIFLFPLLFVWVLRREFPLRSLAAIPMMYTLLLLPARIAGRTWAQLFGIYVNQSKKYGDLVLNAPTVLNWLPNEPKWIGPFTLWFALGVAFAIGVACLLSPQVRTTRLAAKMALVFACLPAFLLPHMHERYLFLADLTSVLYGFFFPSRLWVPVLVVGASFVSYFQFLFGKQPVSMPIASLMIGAATLFVTVDLLRSLYPDTFDA